MGENVHLKKKKQKKNKTTGCCKQTVIIWPLQQCIRVPSNGKKNIDNILLLLIENKVETSRLKPTSFFFFFFWRKKLKCGELQLLFQHRLPLTQRVARPSELVECSFRICFSNEERNDASFSTETVRWSVHGCWKERICTKWTGWLWLQPRAIQRMYVVSQEGWSICFTI